MLVLSRMAGERILIGSRNVVTVTKVRKSQVSLLIEAPFLQVSRDEVPGSGRITDGRLVFSRKKGQGFTIAGMINVSVLKIQGKRVRIGITAPKDVQVRRHEIV